MSAYTGPQGKGARRRHHADKRAAAEIRNANYCPSKKRRFPDEHTARVELVGTTIARNCGYQQRKECRVYECGRCRGWHLTSRPLNAPRKATA